MEHHACSIGGASVACHCQSWYLTAPNKFLSVAGMRISSTSFAAWIITAYVLTLNFYFVLEPGGFGRSSIVDEIFALALSPFAAYFIFHANKRMLVIIALFGCYFLALALASVVEAASGTAGAPWQAPLLGIALDAKPLLFVFGLMFFYEIVHLEQRTKALHRVCRAIVWLGIFNACFAVPNIFTGSALTISGSLQRSDIFGYVPVGLFAHKFQLATLMAVAFLASCALYVEHKRSRYLLAAAVFTTILLACNSAKELIAVPLGAFVVFRSLPAGRNGQSSIPRVLLLVASPALLLIGWEVVQDLLISRTELYIFGTSVRGMMYQASAQIAIDYFPFGSGAGTFGSAPSRDLYYSNLYHNYGLSSSYGASAAYSSYLMDTWWPKVLGEAGIAGAMFYAAALFGPLFIALRSYALSPSLGNILTWTVLVLLLSSAVGSAVFNSDMGMLLWGLAFMALATQETRAAPAKETRTTAPPARPNDRRRVRDFEAS